MSAEQHAARTCPDCGPVSVRTDRITRTQTATGAREKWPCPKCGAQFSHASRPAAPAPPLTQDDLIAFGLALEASPDAAELTQPAEETA